MNKPFNKVYNWVPLICALMLVLGIWLGRVLVSNPGNVSPAQHKVGNIVDLIRTAYVDEVDTDSLIEAMIPDLVRQLDPHSVYIPASELQSVNEELDASFSGIGISFSMLTDTIIVNEVIAGGPSEKVGLLPGDRIITINDSIFAGPKVLNTDVMRNLRGPAGTEVRLGIRRPSAGAELLSYTVVRGEIPVTTVDSYYMLTPEIGYVRVNRFGRPTYSEFFNALANLKYQGAKSFVVDLRGNSGGFMEMANMMANEFLDAGDPIVSIYGRMPSTQESFQANGTGSFKDDNIVVLVDEYSASASEIFAGAMQDNDRGLVIGRRSFGKGLVQRQIDLPDSSALRLTTARYYTPSGRCIQKRYTLGDTESYELEMYDRINHGESFSRDSIKLDESQLYHTAGGREVYGGGGIMPDIFVPLDTTGYSKYYTKVLNAGLLQKFAFNYTDNNRELLNSADSLEDLLDLLPADQDLLYTFVSYANREAGIPVQWYYINISRDLLVNLLKALIARDIRGTSAYYEVMNAVDSTVMRAITEIEAGNAQKPVTASLNTNNSER